MKPKKITKQIICAVAILQMIVAIVGIIILLFGGVSTATSPVFSAILISVNLLSVIVMAIWIKKMKDGE